MPVKLVWFCSKPNDGLLDAMERLSLETAEAGEYHTVHILSTPKTQTAGRSAQPHFEVKLIGTDNGREVYHEHLIFIEHQGTLGRSRFNISKQSRGPSYAYRTLIAVNKPPCGCPKNRRLKREKEAAAAFPDGWYPDPWTTESGKAERYYANNDWTSYTR